MTCRTVTLSAGTRQSRAGIAQPPSSQGEVMAEGTVELADGRKLGYAQ